MSWDSLWAGIPYGLGFLMILQVAKRIANVHFDPLSSFLMNTGGSVPLFRIGFISLQILLISAKSICYCLKILLSSFQLILSHQNSSLFLHFWVIISIFTVIFRFISIFCFLFSIVFDLFYFFRNHTHKLFICLSGVLSKFFLHDVDTPA